MRTEHTEPRSDFLDASVDPTDARYALVPTYIPSQRYSVDFRPELAGATSRSLSW